MRRENEFRYLQLAHILKEQIMSGYIKPGEFLMSENELCKYYGMSRTSVRKSLEQLLKEGLIVKKVGQGTIVSPDVVITAKQSRSKVLRLFATSPSHFFDNGIPLLISQFEKEHPHVEVKCLSLSSGDYWESIHTSKELGLAPDLVFISERQFGEVEDLQRFADLQQLPASGADAIYPRLRNAFTRDGRLKALPVTFSTVYLAYNPDLFAHYGVPEPSGHWTRDEFLTAAARLTRDTNGDGINDLYGLSLSSSLSRWPVFALQNGVDFKTMDRREPTVKTLEFLHELLYKRRIATLTPRSTTNSESFTREKAAMVLTTSIELAGWNLQSMPFEPKVAPLPFGDSRDTMLIANAFMIPGDSNEPELARQFILKAIQPDMQESFSRAGGFLSVLPEINEKLHSGPELESLHVCRDALENCRFIHEMFRDSALVDELEDAMAMYWSGLESAAEFAERMRTILAEA